MGVRASHRPARAVSYGVVSTLGAAVGGCTTLYGAWLLSGFGRWVDVTAARTCLVLAIAAAVAVDTRVIPKRIPQAQQLIPQSRFNGSLIAGVACFAFELGLGFRTRLPSASPVVLVLYVLLLAGWPEVFLLSLGWAIGRCTPIYVRLWIRQAALRRQRGLSGDDRRRSLESFAALTNRLGLAGRTLAPLSTGILVLM